jgi:hypothetical protein
VFFIYGSQHLLFTLQSTYYNYPSLKTAVVYTESPTTITYNNDYPSQDFGWEFQFPGANSYQLHFLSFWSADNWEPLRFGPSGNDVSSWNECWGPSCGANTTVFSTTGLVVLFKSEYYGQGFKVVVSGWNETTAPSLKCEYDVLERANE